MTTEDKRSKEASSDNVAKVIDMKGKNKSKAKELFEKIPIENSPFVVIRQSDNGKCFAVFGKYKITEDMTDVEECIKVATEISWNRMIQVMTLVNDMMSDINELKLKLINK